MRVGSNKRPESALHYAASSFKHRDVGARSRTLPSGICCAAAAKHRAPTRLPKRSSHPSPKIAVGAACGQITTAPRCYEDRHAQVDRWHRRQLILYSVMVARAAWPFTERRSCRQFIDACAAYAQPGRGLILSVFLPSVGNAKAPVRARSGRGAYCNFRYRLPTAGDMVFRAADAVNDLRPLVTARSKASVIDSVLARNLLRQAIDVEVWPRLHRPFLRSGRYRVERSPAHRRLNFWLAQCVLGSSLTAIGQRKSVSWALLP
jgi:hypothetical protein